MPDAKQALPCSACFSAHTTDRSPGHSLVFSLSGLRACSVLPRPLCDLCPLSVWQAYPGGASIVGTDPQFRTKQFPLCLPSRHMLEDGRGSNAPVCQTRVATIPSAGSRGSLPRRSAVTQLILDAEKPREETTPLSDILLPMPESRGLRATPPVRPDHDFLILGRHWQGRLNIEGPRDPLSIQRGSHGLIANAIFDELWGRGNPRSHNHRARMLD